MPQERPFQVSFPDFSPYCHTKAIAITLTKSKIPLNHKLLDEIKQASIKENTIQTLPITTNSTENKYQQRQTTTLEFVKQQKN